MMIGKASGFGCKLPQRLAIASASASKVSAQPAQALFDFRLLEKMLDARGAAIPELKTQPLVAWIGESNVLGEAIKGVVHATLR